MEAPRSPGPRRRDLAAGLLLVALAVTAYGPALTAGWIWDDDHYVTENPTLDDADGLRRIWFEIGAVPQYYPLVHTTFWIESRLWGSNAFGFHAVNVLLHGLNGLLLWLLLRRLAVPGAWVAAAIFVLHPVHVESVAWVTERKNVLSALFYLLALRGWLRYSAVDRGNAWPAYLATLGWFLAALLSKTVTATLPVALLILLWWKRGKIGRIGWSTAPMFAIGGLAGMLTVWMERNVVGALGADWSLGPFERLLVAGRALWFYLGKLVFPYPLIFVYPRWTIDPARLVAWLYPLAALAVAVILWRRRDRWGRGPFAAAAFYAVTLAPALGFLNVYPMRFSFVADHFQYLASIGPITLAVAAVACVRPRPARPAGSLVVAVLLLALGSLTWQQALDYEDEETLWTATLSRNPAAHIAHNNLGALLLRRSGEATEPEDRTELLDQARRHLELAAEERYPEAYNNLGIVLHRLGRLDEAMQSYREALGLQPRFADALNNLGISVAESGRMDEAAGYFTEAVRLDPEMASAQFNLASALIRAGRPAEALPYLERVVRLEPDNLQARQVRDRVRAELSHPRSNVAPEAP